VAASGGCIGQHWRTGGCDTRSGKATRADLLSGRHPSFQQALVDAAKHLHVHDASQHLLSPCLRLYRSCGDSQCQDLPEV
jgi:hypothetical protein